MANDSDEEPKPKAKKTEYREEKVASTTKGEAKKKKKKYSSSEESSEGGYKQAPVRHQPVAVEEPTGYNPLSKAEPKKNPPKPEPKRVYVDEDDSDDGLGRWNS